ncbi:MAG: ribosome recycling factor [Chloroflexi bacterium]|nr:MAG: ribosome recycling factor [Chloroflexota bacterium]
MEIPEVLSKAEAKMSKAVEILERELLGLRTGRASPALVENIRADYYGVPTPIKELASIAVPEARLLVIQPWDKNALPAIEKAILKSELGITPSNDGNVIRLVIPQLTEERRRDLVKLVRKRVEEGKVAIRNVRREALEKIRLAEKEKEISEDEARRFQDKLQKLTDGFIEDMDRLGRNKEAEIMEV